MSAFGKDKPAGRCNLCAVEGRRVFLFDPSAPDWMQLVEAHTKQYHPEHQALIESAPGAYEPVEVSDRWT